MNNYSDAVDGTNVDDTRRVLRRSLGAQQGQASVCKIVIIISTKLPFCIYVLKNLRLGQCKNAVHVEVHDLLESSFGVIIQRSTPGCTSIIDQDVKVW